MNKKLARILTLSLALLLIFTACTTPSQQTATDAPTNTQQESQAPQETQATQPAAQEPTDLTMFYKVTGTSVPDDFDHADNYYFKYICELANVNVTELIVPAYADTETKFNLMMSSGDIPDFVLHSDAASMKQYGEEGAFQPTEDIIRNSEVLSNIYDDVQIEAMRSSDGVVYVVQSWPNNDDYNCLATRMDLLDEIGVGVPETTDDMLEACRGLKELYPNSIPIVVRGAVWAYMHPLFQPFNAGRYGIDWHYDYDKGEVVSAFEGDNVVDAVTFAKQLYDEKLLDPEFITTTTSDYTTKIIDENNKVLIYSRNFGSIPGYALKYLNSGQSEARVIPFAFPTAEGQEFRAYRALETVGGWAVGINAKTSGDTLDGAIRLLDTISGDDVLKLSIYGREDVDFEMVDGVETPIYPAAIENFLFATYGWMFMNNKEKKDYQFKTYIYSSDALSDTEKADYLELIQKSDAAAREVTYGTAGYDILRLAEPLSDEVTNRRNECVELQKSLLAKAIIGEISIDEFAAEKDKIVDKYQDVTQAYNKVMEDAKEKYGLDQYGFAN